MSDEQQRAIQVPDNMLVECPRAGRRLRAVSVCLTCEDYVGLVERLPDAKTPFAKRFMVGCRYPFARAIFEMEEIAIEDSIEPIL